MDGYKKVDDNNQFHAVCAPHEDYNTKAATCVQKITKYVNDAKKGYLIDVFNP